ncbi:hypothetical protein FRUB_03143 [Fimbriiglobus ruber]|uniref:Glycosyltransferase RgtA/B/C/D-like domain-containing protein n=2 Tax=Fimbriiglobus ruber TaxID=1908690 RepID=A0A225DV56_9BACT|nr:hypothetical protein FRUB_03143 [Fimbriiglobus ruber]
MGATFDEPFYIASGLQGWRDGTHRPLIKAGTMPLPVDVQTLPVYVWERYRGEPFQHYIDLARLLPVARSATLLFWWLLLFYGMLFGRALGGPWAGRLACGLLAADPTLLAHATLATTDLPLTACVLLASYHWYRGRDHGWFLRIVVPGFCYMIALAAKASSFAFVPLLFGVLGLDHVIRSGAVNWPAGDLIGPKIRALWTATYRLRWDLVLALWLGFILVFFFCGCDWADEPTFIEWAEGLDDGPVKNVMLPFSQNLRIFSNAGEGLVYQIAHNIRGHHGSYLLGEYRPQGRWYYFPVALSAKLPIPALALLAFVLAARTRAFLNPVGWATVALLAFSLTCRVQIGVRFQLPLVAFLYIAMAIAACRRPGWVCGWTRPAPTPTSTENAVGTESWRLSGSNKVVPSSTSPRPDCQTDSATRLALALGFLALALNVAVAATAWPDGLLYTNELYGGTVRGREIYSDSNYDWGQGLPDLKVWYQEHRGQPLFVWFYGTDPQILMPPFKLFEIHREPNVTPALVAEAVGNGYLAVGVTLLDGCPDRRPELLAVVEWLKTQKEVGRTGTFVIYQFR